MRVGFESKNEVDSDGNPSGGFARGVGFDIRWQSGPLGRPADEATLESVRSCPEPGWHTTHRYCPCCPWTEDLGRSKPNGAFVEDVLDAVKNRLEFYQEASDGKFACSENQAAIASITQALAALDRRTRRREHLGIEGTHQPDPAEPELTEETLRKALTESGSDVGTLYVSKGLEFAGVRLVGRNPGEGAVPGVRLVVDSLPGPDGWALVCGVEP